MRRHSAAQAVREAETGVSMRAAWTAAGLAAALAWTGVSSAQTGDFDPYAAAAALERGETAADGFDPYAATAPGGTFDPYAATGSPVTAASPAPSSSPLPAPAPALTDPDDPYAAYRALQSGASQAPAVASAPASIQTPAPAASGAVDPYAAYQAYQRPSSAPAPTPAAAPAIAAAPAQAARGEAPPEARQRMLSFRYGKYCGPGLPVQTASKDQVGVRLGVLERTWPPVDDLDALCFAHDYCFEIIGHDSAPCDDAMAEALAAAARNMSAGCRSTAGGMYQAFVYKPWSRGALGTASGIVRAAERLDGGVDGDGVGAFLLAEAARRSGAASLEGVCNRTVNEPRPGAMAGLFASYVNRSAEFSSFRICTPPDRAAGRCQVENAAMARDPRMNDPLENASRQVDEISGTVRSLGGLFGRE